VACRDLANFICDHDQFLGQVAKNRTDLLPHYSRLVATLNRYMPDLGAEIVAVVNFWFLVSRLVMSVLIMTL
jgi:hypothetical protein